jgi:sugar phosphate isomerase/epimerase
LKLGSNTPSIHAYPSYPGVGYMSSAVELESVLRKQLDFIGGLDLENVELYPGRLDLIRNGWLNEKGCSSILDMLSSYDFTYTAHAPYKTNLASPSMLKISDKIVRSCIDFCVMLGAQILVLHSGYITPDDEISESKSLKLLADSVRKIAEYAHDSGVLIGIENGDLGPTHLCRRIDWLVDVVKDVDMFNVGITFDFGHAYVSAGYYKFDFLKAVEKALPFMIHAHVNDNFGRFNPLSPHSTNHDLNFGFGDLHLPIGWGTIPYKDVFCLVKGTYNGIYTLELRPRFREYYNITIVKLRELLG